MVSFQQLNSVDAGLWTKAASDWMNLGKDIYTQAQSVQNDIGDPLKDDWSGDAATVAKSRILQSVSGLEAAKVEVEAIGEILQGLGEAVAQTQRMLTEGLNLAAQAGLTVSADGKNTSLPGDADSPEAKRALSLIHQALQRATAIDTEAAQWLMKAAGRRWVDTPFTTQGTYNTDGNDGSRTELDLIRKSIPTGPPDVVAAWWAGLSPSEQETLKLAAPEKIGTIKGIPESVQQELAGSNGVNRVKLIKYAMDNWDNKGDHIYDNDCTNFVSDALAAAGMHQKGNLFGHADAKNDWFKSDVPGERLRSRSWTGADELHTFMTHNNSTDNIPLSQVRPGDVLFFKGTNGGIHHAAVVTSVYNGRVFYTQHSSPAQNADWTQRGSFYEEIHDRQTPIVVRPAQP